VASSPCPRLPCTPTVERGDALLDRDAQPVELELLLGSALLQGADGVAHRLAGVAVFAVFEDVVDEGVLFRCQADVARGIANSPVCRANVAILATVANSRPARWAKPCGGLDLRMRRRRFCALRARDSGLPIPSAGLFTPRRACRPRLAARLCALLRKQGDQDLNPFSHPHGPKRNGERLLRFQESALSETAGARFPEYRVPGLIEKACIDG